MPLHALSIWISFTAVILKMRELLENQSIRVVLTREQEDLTRKLYERLMLLGMAGEILYQGRHQGFPGSGALTGKAMEMEIPFKAEPRKPKGFLPVKHASLHNLKQVILVDQSPVTAIGRSTPATFLGFFDDIRKQQKKSRQKAGVIIK